MDYTYLFNLMCQRRLVKLSKVESAALTFTIDSGTPNNTPILAVDASAFYYVDWMVTDTLSSVSGIPRLTLGEIPGAPVAGNASLNMAGLVKNFGPFECEFMTFDLNSMTSGFVTLLGVAFKITYIV